METAIQLYDRIQDPVSAAVQLGTFFAKSGMFGVEKAEAGTILALACMAERKSPFELARTYHMIDGKLSKKALAIAAEFRVKGGKIEWLNTGKDGKKAEARFTFEGQVITESFTIEEAKMQGLVRAGSTWIKAPANMLRARVLSNAVAMLAPEIVAGFEDGGHDAEPSREEKPIFATQPEQRPVVTVVSEPAKTVAPEPQPEPEPEPIDVESVALVKKAEIDPATGKLTAATIATLQHLIGERNCDKAIEWLKAKNQVRTSLLDLTQPWAQKIIDDSEKFIGAIGGAK